MKNPEYISRKLFDRYQDRFDLKVERVYKDLKKLKARVSNLEEAVEQIIGLDVRYGDGDGDEE